MFSAKFIGLIVSIMMTSTAVVAGPAPVTGAKAAAHSNPKHGPSLTTKLAKQVAAFVYRNFDQDNLLIESANLNGKQSHSYSCWNFLFLSFSMVFSLNHGLGHQQLDPFPKPVFYHRAWNFTRAVPTDPQPFLIKNPVRSNYQSWIMIRSGAGEYRDPKLHRKSWKEKDLRRNLYSKDRETKPNCPKSRCEIRERWNDVRSLYREATEFRGRREKLTAVLGRGRDVNCIRTPDDQFFENWGIGVRVDQRGKLPARVIVYEDIAMKCSKAINVGNNVVL
ncbi:hypothetical protein L218DRAFT_1027479 [Marasmius fiardii PR-910]|nr:hypothetical protein L218DRAFT_1027479 [Marasmius fiardii PR-910]